MGLLTLTDLSGKFQSTVFLSMVEGEFLKALKFFGSGFLAEAPDNVVNTGLYGNMPKWVVDLTDATAITASSTLTPGENSNFNDTFSWMELEYGWSAQELINTVAGRSYDSLEDIAKHIGQYWAFTIQKRAINVLKGAHATALATSNSTGATYSGSIITNAGIVAAKYKLGDFFDKLSLIIMNSKVHADAVSGNLVTFPAGDVGNRTFETGDPGRILGLQPYADDDLAAVSSVYPTYLGGPRSMTFKMRPRAKSGSTAGMFARTGNNIDLEYVRDAYTAGGVDTLITRISVMVHLPGVAFNPAAPNPSISDLATGSNWTKVADTKQIKVAELKTL